MLKAAFAGLVLTVSGFTNAGLITINESDFSGSETLMTFEDVNGGLIPASYGSSVGVEFTSGTRGNAHANYGSTLVASANNAGFGLQAVTWGGDGSGVYGSGFKFDSVMNKVSFYIGSNVNIFDVQIQALLNGVSVGQISVAFVAANSFAFIGLSEAVTGFDQIFIGNETNCGGGCIHQLDNLRFEAEVPEPSTLAILALGLIGLGARRFKK